MLDEIKKRIQIDLQLGNGAIILDQSDVNWLIKQAEKVNMLDNRIVEINSKWQLLYDEMKEEIVDMQQYIKNGIEFGYIDDREDDYNKFFQCNNKTLEERKEQLNKSIENAKMITKEDEMEELIKRNYIKREM